MKVIKRDGRAVDYNKEKIAIAIEKANQEVREQDRATKQEIKEIIKYIEELNKKRMLVEDIQDIIEEQLMERKRFELAKKYIVYRYTRALVRKQNTTDQSILGLIRNESSNQNTILASNQRDYIAGEVSKDLTNRILLPEKIVKAHQEGAIFFHDAEYFVQPIFNSCFINLEDMLDNGTVINGKLIESPKSFQVACIVMTQILATVASNQYGGEYVDIKPLGKYLRRSYEKYKKEIQLKYEGKITEEIIEQLVKDRVNAELKSGVQTIQYQINTLMTANGKAPFVTIFLSLEEKDPYAKENAMIIEEILKQRYNGIKNEEGIYITPEYPKYVYILNKNNYLTNLAKKCANQTKMLNLISAKELNEKRKTKFNQGVVSINLPQIGIIADEDEEKFWEILNERLEICKEALMCRHYALLHNKSDVSPIHWQYGAIARLKKDEVIDKFLYGKYSTLSLGYVGIDEVTKLMKEKEFEVKIVKYLNDKIEQWKNETNIGFELYENLEENIGKKLASIDKEKYGIITGVTDKGYYTTTNLNITMIE